MPNPVDNLFAMQTCMCACCAGPSIFITPDDYVSIATTWPSSVGSRNLVHWAQVGLCCCCMLPQHTVTAVLYSGGA
jgi:hypothetical protein